MLGWDKVPNPRILQLESSIPSLWSASIWVWYPKCKVGCYRFSVLISWAQEVFILLYYCLCKGLGIHNLTEAVWAPSETYIGQDYLQSHVKWSNESTGILGVLTRCPSVRAGKMGGSSQRTLQSLCLCVLQWEWKSQQQRRTQSADTTGHLFTLTAEHGTPSWADARRMRRSFAGCLWLSQRCGALTDTYTPVLQLPLHPARACDGLYWWELLATKPFLHLPMPLSSSKLSPFIHESKHSLSDCPMVPNPNYKHK